MYIHCMYYSKDLAALHNGSAHKLRRYHLPCASMLNIHRSRQAHNSMTSLSTKGADSFMGLLCSKPFRTNYTIAAPKLEGHAAEHRCVWGIRHSHVPDGASRGPATNRSKRHTPSVPFSQRMK